MIDERRQRQAHLADDLGPHVQRRVGVWPGGPGQGGPVAVGSEHREHLIVPWPAPLLLPTRLPCGRLACDMVWLRPRLARIASGWLVVHFCLLALIPTALGSTLSAGAADTECTCALADRATCPMHHSQPKSPPTSGSHSCSCRSTADPMATMASALIGPTAVLAPATSVVGPAAVPVRVPSADFESLESPSLPDAPPPRR